MDVLSQQKPQTSTVVTTPSSSAPADAAAIGTATDYARGDHAHGREAAQPVRVASTARAATTTLPSGHDIIVPITGTGPPTITSITAAASGTRATLEFQSAAVFVTNGSNLKLQADYNSTVLGTLTLESDGTNWIEIGRTPLTTSTSPTTQAFGDSSVIGTAGLPARDDHKHGMPADPVPAHNVATNVHGLPASTAVLGNRMNETAYCQYAQPGVTYGAPSAFTMGQVHDIASGGTIAFPVVFPNVCRAVVLGGGETANAYVGCAFAMNTSGFKVRVYDLSLIHI